MAYKRKYTKGDRITSIDEMVQQEFVYIHDKIYHAGWFMSFQLSWARRMIEVGSVFREDRRIDHEAEP